MTEIVTSYILDDIPFRPDIPALMKRLRLKAHSAKAEELAGLVAAAQSLARPKALYLETYVSERGPDWLVIGGVRFTSRVLKVNLEQAYRVFPYLITCGTELQDWSDGITDILLRYWADAIKEAALVSAFHAFDTHLDAAYHPGHTAHMSPGSLPDWPLQEQCVLFELFGSHAGKIGVTLNDSMLMTPNKTVSGIRFPTEVEFESCQLCGRADCPGRRAPYEPHLFESRFKAS